VVSRVRGLRIVGSSSSLAHAHQVAAPPDVAIVPDTLTAEQPLPRLATGGSHRMLDMNFAKCVFPGTLVNRGKKKGQPPSHEREPRPRYFSM
jgi:hypothetical protein